MAKFFSMDGYVCGDIERRSTSSGQMVTSFTLNCPDRRQINGEWKSIPNYFKCQYWHHGEHDYRDAWIYDKAHLQVSGQPRYEEWEGQYGKRSMVRFNCENLLLIATKDMAEMAAPAPEPQQQQLETETASLYDEDIPF